MALSARVKRALSWLAASALIEGIAVAVLAFAVRMPFEKGEKLYLAFLGLAGLGLLVFLMGGWRLFRARQDL